MLKECGIEVCFAVSDSEKCGYELLRNGRFHEISARTGVKTSSHGLQRIVLTEDQDTGVWEVAPNFLCRVDPIHLGHADVHDDGVGFQLLCFFDGVPTIRRFAAHLKASTFSEYGTNTQANENVVVDN
jgi:hypothetical protein